MYVLFFGVLLTAEPGNLTSFWEQVQAAVWFRIHLGGCQNSEPFLDPYYNTAPNI